MAASLSLDTQPVTQIGRFVGWPDQNYFARRFKAHFGLSATSYRSRFADSARQLQPWPGTSQDETGPPHRSRANQMLQARQDRPEGFQREPLAVRIRGERTACPIKEVLGG